MFKCSGFVPFRMIINAEPQSEHRVKIIQNNNSDPPLTCLSVRLDRVQSAQWITTAGNVGISPELCTGQLQHFSADFKMYVITLNLVTKPEYGVTSKFT